MWAASSGEIRLKRVGNGEYAVLIVLLATPFARPLLASTLVRARVLGGKLFSTKKPFCFDTIGEQDVVLFVDVDMRVAFEFSKQFIALFPGRARMRRGCKIISERVDPSKCLADIVVVVDHAVDRAAHTPRRSAGDFGLPFQSPEPWKQHAFLTDEMVVHVLGQGGKYVLQFHESWLIVAVRSNALPDEDT